MTGMSQRSRLIEIFACLRILPYEYVSEKLLLQCLGIDFGRGRARLEGSFRTASLPTPEADLLLIAADPEFFLAFLVSERC